MRLSLRIEACPFLLSALALLALTLATGAVSRRLPHLLQPLQHHRNVLEAPMKQSRLSV